MKHGWCRAAALVGLTACGGAAGDAPVPRATLAPLAPVADTTWVPPFSADRAFAHIVTQVGFGPRVPGTEGHARQLAWLLEFLQARADSVRVQRFEHVSADRSRVVMANVLARFRPDAPERILLLAHWDTRPRADNDADPARRALPIAGANDGASGVAVLLELADVLSRHSPPIGVDLLFTDGEDFGATGGEMFLGAKYFAANMPAGYAPLYGVLLDMVADAEPHFRLEGHSRRFAPDVVERVWSLAEALGHGDVFSRQHWGDIGDDHVPLNRAGVPTISIIDFDFGPGNAYWHTQQDDLHNVSPRGPGIVGEVLTHLIFRGG